MSIKNLNYFFMLIFSKSNYLLKCGCKRLFIRLSKVFAFGLIRYSYQTGIIYMYGRGERPFFWWGLLQFQEDKRHA